MIKISKIVPARLFVPSIVFMCSLFSLSLSATRASLREDMRRLFTQREYTIQDKTFYNVKIMFVNSLCLGVPDPCDGQDSWNRGFKTIREAVAKAKTLHKEQLGVILVKEGTYQNYTEFWRSGREPDPKRPVLELTGKPNLVIIGGFVGNERATGPAWGDLSQKRSILHGLATSSGVISAAFSDSETRTPHYVEIRNFKIMGGCANRSGKIACSLPRLFLGDETLRGIYELGFFGDSGGGLKVWATEGSRLRFSVRDSKFVGNKASSRGGAMAFSLPSQDAKVSIVDSEFEDNQAGFGGAFYGVTAEYEFRDNLFRNNEGVFGGGAYYADQTQTHLGINNDFYDNKSRKGYGGAIMVVQSRSFVIDDDTMGDRRDRTEDREKTSTYSGNGAWGPRGRGGAIYVRLAVGPVTIIGPKIFRNTAALVGGGIAIVGRRQEAGAQPAPIRLSNMWIARNIALSAGGGIYLKNVPGEPFIEGVNLISNQALTKKQNRDFIEKFNRRIPVDPKELLLDRGQGGGLYAAGTKVRILSSSFEYNSAGHGGGAHVTKGSASFRDLTFRGNTALRWGGAIKLFECTEPIVSNKLDLQKNISFHGTGGIHARASELKLEGESIIADNIAQNEAGGGITLNKGSKLIMSPGATLTLSKNISRARAPDGAGAIFVENSEVVEPMSAGGGWIRCNGNTRPNTVGQEVAGCEN